ncbi:putative beta-galactosidase [Helianthus annuus]|nr:putative beta-galactosidase [Helianthus annuus]
MNTPTRIYVSAGMTTAFRLVTGVILLAAFRIFAFCHDTALCKGLMGIKVWNGNTYWSRGLMISSVHPVNLKWRYVRKSATEMKGHPHNGSWGLLATSIGVNHIGHKRCRIKGSNDTQPTLNAKVLQWIQCLIAKLDKVFKNQSPLRQCQNCHTQQRIDYEMNMSKSQHYYWVLPYPNLIWQLMVQYFTNYILMAKYFQCGSITEVIKVFHLMLLHDFLAWNNRLMGIEMHAHDTTAPLDAYGVLKWGPFKDFQKAIQLFAAALVAYDPPTTSLGHILDVRVYTPSLTCASVHETDITYFAVRYGHKPLELVCYLLAYYVTAILEFQQLERAPSTHKQDNIVSSRVPKKN